MQNDKKEDLETSCGVSHSSNKNVYVPKVGSISGALKTVSAISGPNIFSRYFYESERFCTYRYNSTLGLRF